MKNENELKALLDRLRDETRLAPDQAPAAPAAKPLPQPEAPRSRPPVPAPRPLRRDLPPLPGTDARRFDRPRQLSPEHLVWSENKESMLLGVLASLAAILAGLLAGRDYLVLAGAVCFLLFSCVMALTLFGYYLNFRNASVPETPSSARLEQLSRRLDVLEEKLLSGRAVSMQAGPSAADGGLERKVEELRKIVRSLARAVNGTPLPGETPDSGRKDDNKEV